MGRGGTPTSIGWPRDDICWAPGHSVGPNGEFRTLRRQNSYAGPDLGKEWPRWCSGHRLRTPGTLRRAPRGRQSRADGIQNGFSSGVIRLGKKPLAAVRQELATNRSRTPGSGGTTTPPTRSVPRMPAHIRVSSHRGRGPVVPPIPWYLGDGVRKARASSVGDAARAGGRDLVPECDVSGGALARAPRRIGGGRDAFVYPCAYPWAVTGASMSGVASGAEVADAAASLGAVPMM